MSKLKCQRCSSQSKVSKVGHIIQFLSFGSAFHNSISYGKLLPCTHSWCPTLTRSDMVDPHPGILALQHFPSLIGGLGVHVHLWEHGGVGRWFHRVDGKVAVPWYNPGQRPPAETHYSYWHWYSHQHFCTFILPTGIWVYHPRLVPCYLSIRWFGWNVCG